MTKLIKMDCLKCNGSGYIRAYAGIANGVCFTCNGAGFRMVKPAAVKPVKPASEYQAKMIDTICNGDLSNLTYAQLNTLREFAHWTNPHCPNLLEIWRERGDSFFFAAQDTRLER